MLSEVTVRANLLQATFLGFAFGMIGCDPGGGASEVDTGLGGNVAFVTGGNAAVVGGVAGTTGNVGMGGNSLGGTVAAGGTGWGNTGNTATGGTSSSTTGPITSACSEANVEACAANNSNKVGKHCGLTYEIWTDSSNSCMTNTASGFKASWTTANGNYLARKGVRPGSTSPVVTYSANYQPNGNSYLAIYGWTQSPLIEYYIVDSWGTWRPPGTDAIGTVTVDGGTYDIYQSFRDNKPSIEGDTDFYQYWSVRREKRTSGTITVAPHFEAWKKFGLTMGKFYEVSLVIEGYQSSGSADVTVAFK
jgi:endo-1,4-beta-xylanase